MSPGVDTNLFMWTLAWDAHAIAHSPAALFQANIFFPFANSLAFSENLLGSSIVSAPILWLGGRPALAMNLVALLSIPLSALGAFILARTLGLSGAAATLAGIVFGFAPPRFFRIDQLHLTTVQWIPFCLAFAHAYLRSARPRDLRIAIAFFTAQALTSGHGAVFLSTAIILLAAYEVVRGAPLQIVRRARDFGAIGVLLLVPVILVLLPYRRVQDEVDIVRTLADYRAVSWQSFFASPSHVHRWIVDTFVPRADIIGRAGAYLFPGILPLVLAAIALAPRRERLRPSKPAAALILECAAIAAAAIAVFASLYAPLRWRINDITLFTVRDPFRTWLFLFASVAARAVLRRSVPLQLPRYAAMAWSALRHPEPAAHGTRAGFYGLLTLVCIWISAPPPVSLWPHVYWLPGFSFIRAPSRFMILGVLGLAVLAAIGFDRVRQRFAGAARVLAAFVLGALMIGEFSAAPLGVAVEPGVIPAIDRWLATQAGSRVIAEAPVLEEIREHDAQQSQYMLHSMAHWQRTVHGYSGVHPPLTDGLYEHLINFPSDETIRALKSINVDTVVVHLDAFPAAVRPDIERRLTGQPALRLEHVEGDGRVYSIR